MNEMTKHVFLGCVNGTWKDERTGKETPTYTVYLGKQMLDKNGNEYGYGYKPLTLKVSKDIFNEFTALEFGVEVLAAVFMYKNQFGNYSYKLMGYEI